jgi:UTP:GlnB (protein PII) uridylyltransferase
MNELGIKLASDWPAIRKAIANTERDLTELERLLLPSDGRPLAENVSLVLFGSLARGESTSQSDLDWTLLVNGEVDGQHGSDRDLRWLSLQP